jgi:hypothetical protein
VVEAIFDDQKIKLGNIDANIVFVFIYLASSIHQWVLVRPFHLPAYPNPTLLANVFCGISDTLTFRTATYSDTLNEFEALHYISQWTSYLKASIFQVGVWH